MGEANGQWVGQLDKLVERWHLLQHPFYQAWMAGRLTRDDLRLYAAQYHRHVQAFPEYLKLLAERADDSLRPVIEENLAEELSPGRTHPELWRDFAAAVGMSGTELDAAAPRPETAVLVETFRRLCAESSPAEAVAALYAYESQVPEIAAKKIDGLRRFYGVSEPKGLSYFAVHEEADVRHRAAWRSWLAANGAEENGRALAAAEQALRALWGALDGVTPAACRK